jgi:hypothetical protein
MPPKDVPTTANDTNDITAEDDERVQRGGSLLQRPPLPPPHVPASSSPSERGAMATTLWRQKWAKPRPAPAPPTHSVFSRRVISQPPLVPPPTPPPPALVISAKEFMEPAPPVPAPPRTKAKGKTTSRSLVRSRASSRNLSSRRYSRSSRVGRSRGSQGSRGSCDGEVASSLVASSLARPQAATAGQQRDSSPVVLLRGCSVTGVSHGLSSEAALEAEAVYDDDAPPTTRDSSTSAPAVLLRECSTNPRRDLSFLPSGIPRGPPPQVSRGPPPGAPLRGRSRQGSPDTTAAAAASPPPCDPWTPPPSTVTATSPATSANPIRCAPGDTQVQLLSAVLKRSQSMQSMGQSRPLEITGNRDWGRQGSSSSSQRCDSRVTRLRKTLSRLTSTRSLGSLLPRSSSATSAMSHDSRRAVSAESSARAISRDAAEAADERHTDVLFVQQRDFGSTRTHTGVHL